MSKTKHPIPFDGAVTKFFDNDAPKKLRKRIEAATKQEIVSDTYPYQERMPKEEYERLMEKLQIELVKFQAWVRDTQSRVVIVFEGRDASGKGGTIKRFRENLNPRRARVVALTAPSDRERTQFYFQRYMQHIALCGGDRPLSIDPGTIAAWSKRSLGSAPMRSASDFSVRCQALSGPWSRTGSISSSFGSMSARPNRSGAFSNGRKIL